jgi:hypothetical protein
MVGLSSILDRKDALLEKRELVIDATKRLFQENEPGTFTGRGNTKADIKERIQKYQEMIAGIL